MMKISSRAFENDGNIPVRYTGFVEDISPGLVIQNIDARAASLALILDDLDVPLVGEFCHWVIWNILPCGIIPEGLPGGERIIAPISAVQGNAWGRHRYRGPKQPPFIHKAHRYRFRVYALDCMLETDPVSGKKALLRGMDGHILETADLYGVYRHDDKKSREI